MEIPSGKQVGSPANVEVACNVPKGEPLGPASEAAEPPPIASIIERDPNYLARNRPIERANRSNEPAHAPDLAGPEREVAPPEPRLQAVLGKAEQRAIREVFETHSRLTTYEAHEVVEVEAVTTLLDQATGVVEVVEPLLRGATETIGADIPSWARELHQEVEATRTAMVNLQARVAQGVPVRRSELDQFVAGVLRIVISTCVGALLGGAVIGFVLDNPLLTKALEGALSGLAGGVANEMSHKMTATGPTFVEKTAADRQPW